MRASKAARQEILLADEAHKQFILEMRDRYNALGRPDRETFLALMRDELHPDEYEQLKESFMAIQMRFEGEQGEELNRALERFSEKEVQYEAAEAILAATGRKRRYTPMTDLRRRLDAFMEGAKAGAKDARREGNERVKAEREKAREKVRETRDAEREKAKERLGEARERAKEKAAQQKERYEERLGQERAKRIAQGMELRGRMREFKKLQRELAAHARKVLQGGDIMKSELNRIMRLITNAKTGGELQEAFGEIDAIAFEQAKRYAQRRLKEFLERTKGKKENGVLKGRGLGADAHKMGALVKEIIGMEPEDAAAKADELREELGKKEEAYLQEICQAG